MEPIEQAQGMWLYTQLSAGTDVVLLDVLDTVGDRTKVTARIRHCYTDFYTKLGGYVTGSATFGVGLGSFGNKPVSPGESVIVELDRCGGGDDAQLYENHWQGNFLLHEIDGALHAVARFKLPEDKLPPFIRSAIVPVPPFYSAIPFPLLEDYLMAVIPAVHGVEAVRSPLAQPRQGEPARPPFRLPGKMMSRHDFLAFRMFARRHRAYVIVCTSAEPRDPGRRLQQDSDSPFMARYFLHGVYSEDKVSLWQPGTAEQLRSDLNDALGGDRIVFGPLDSWEHREQPQPRMLLFQPDGDADPLIYHPEVNQRHIARRGLPWPFPTVGK